MSLRKKIGDRLSDYGIIFVFIFLFIMFTIATPKFLTMSNIFNILRQVSIIGIISVGMTFVLLSGGIDLSVGSIAGVSAIGASLLMVEKGINPWISALVMLILGITMGLLNGIFVTFFNVPPMIATLGMMTSLRGVAYIISDGLPVFGFDQRFVVLGQGYIGFIPIPVIVSILVFAIGIFVLTKTKTGRYLYAIGGNQEAARLSGISIHKTKLIAYGVSGFTAALAGLVILARINSGQPNAGDGYEMEAITSCVLGGVSISGGQGNLQLVLFGVIIMGILTNGMTMLTVNEYVQRLIKGLVLVGAVAIDQFIKSRKSQTAIPETK